MKTILYLFLFLAVFHTGCKKLVEVDRPSTSTSADKVYATDADATAVLSNIYMKMSVSGITDRRSLTSLSLFAGLSADEFRLFPGVTDQGYLAYYQNSLSTSVAAAPDYWSAAYKIIYTANAAIEGITASTTLSVGVKQQLLGEAKFMRAFSYFYLVNLYGDVPLNVSTNYKENSVRPRTAKDKVYEQIIADLEDAQGLLSEDYKTSTLLTTEERVKPNKYVAAALLARTYLFTGKNELAEAASTAIIENTSLYDTVPVENVFLKNSKETIWALQPIFNNAGAVTNTSDAILFIPQFIAPVTFPVSLSTELTGNLAAPDKRGTVWVGITTVNGVDYKYAAKYKNNQRGSTTTEYPIVFRLAEQYLIRAEARARQDNITGAAEDLNIIRTRAGLPGITANSQEEMIEAVLQERQTELFTEWGHRWLDLKRTGNADAVLGPVKGANWQTTDQLYLIPQNELDNNPAIAGHQNP